MRSKSPHVNNDLKMAGGRVQEHEARPNALPAEGPMQCPDRLRLPLSFDTDLLAADLARLSVTPWIDHFVTQNYEGSWSVIPLRAPAGARHPIQMIYADPTATTFEDTPILAGCPYFRTLLASLACPLQAARLMRLTPGSTIKEHTDLDLRFEQGSVRLHIPVITNAGVEFELNRRRVILDDRFHESGIEKANVYGTGRLLVDSSFEKS
jgi:Aspartyl/Asparaginyl beta-hydroxylase